MVELLRVLILSALLGCGPEDHSHDAWLPHVPTAWAVTPDGHTRDAGPFGSVEAGYVTDAEIDAAVDYGFRHLTEATGYAAPAMPVGLNDDYVMWSKQLRLWCAGMETCGDGVIHVTLWSRGESADDPGPCWISRPPGNYWGVSYPAWRHTSRPLAPAIAHELLHAVIGDPDHVSPLWARL